MSRYSDLYLFDLVQTESLGAFGPREAERDRIPVLEHRLVPYDPAAVVVSSFVPTLSFFPRRRMPHSSKSPSYSSANRL